MRQTFYPNSKQTGEGTFTDFPVGVSFPEALLILKTTIESERWFAASKYPPDGSIAKLRGVFPPDETCSISCNFPVFLSILQQTMLSCPRFDA